MTLRDDLIAAKALIDTPEKWCKRPGWIQRPSGMARCAYAAMGGALHVTWDGKESTRDVAFRLLRRALPLRHRLRHFFSGGRTDDGAVIRFNDEPSTTHADIMALFDRAIEAASKTEVKDERK